MVTAPLITPSDSGCCWRVKVISSSYSIIDKKSLYQYSDEHPLYTTGPVFDGTKVQLYEKAVLFG